jgi:cyclopropane fatty-acyl-phospholipid synthase-like methyltransferase
VKQTENEFWNYGEEIYPSQAVIEGYLGQLVHLFSPGRTVADLGCGRGEFLNVMKESGHHAIGVDLSSHSRDIVTRKGFPFYQMDIIEFLETSQAAYNGLFTYGLIEHLDADTISKLFRVMGQNCHYGTEAIFATHNPSSIQALTRPLFSELTHERLYSQELLEFLFESNGFEIRKVGSLVQPQKLISDKALTVDENKRFIAGLNEIREKGKSVNGQRQIEYLAGRVNVIELILTEIVQLLNVPMDYFVFATKK